MVSPQCKGGKEYIQCEKTPQITTEPSGILIHVQDANVTSEKYSIFWYFTTALIKLSQELPVATIQISQSYLFQWVHVWLKFKWKENYFTLSKRFCCCLNVLLSWIWKPLVLTLKSAVGHDPQIMFGFLETNQTSPLSSWIHSVLTVNHTNVISFILTQFFV